MSGLAALLRIGGPSDRAPAARMVRALDARGPEARDEAIVADGVLAVAIGAPGETAAGVARHASGRWVVAADGELLNARALLAELRGWDEAPEEETTAAIAAAFFASRGFVGGLDRLAGDVALVAWDTETRTLWAARDRAGLRPMVWATLPDGTLLVASEPAALLAHPNLDRAVDGDALREALALGAPLPPRTPWRAIHALGPGELLTWSAAGASVRRWWDDDANPPGADGARYRWARSVQFGAELAVQQRVAVDAPLAVALSGGVYAEALLGAAAARRREALVALTLAPDGGPDPRAAIIATRNRAEHVLVPLRTDDVPALLGEAVSVEPLLAPEAVAWWALARAAWERGAQVLLTGAGGAALFGGAAPPLVDRAASVRGLARLGRAARAAVPAEPWARRYLTRTRGVADGPWESIDALAATSPTTDPTGAALWLERRLAAADAHTLVDRAAAAHGVRAQSPFADAPLAKLVASVPIGHLVQVRRPRGLFLDAFAERVDADAPAHAPMQLPVDAWLADGRLTNGAAEALEGVLDGDLVRRILAERSPRRRWAIAALSAWRARNG